VCVKDGKIYSGELVRTGIKPMSIHHGNQEVFKIYSITDLRNPVIIELVDEDVGKILNAVNPPHKTKSTASYEVNTMCSCGSMDGRHSKLCSASRFESKQGTPRISEEKGKQDNPHTEQINYEKLWRELATENKELKNMINQRDKRVAEASLALEQAEKDLRAEIVGFEDKLKTQHEIIKDLKRENLTLLNEKKDLEDELEEKESSSKQYEARLEAMRLECKSLPELESKISELERKIEFSDYKTKLDAEMYAMKIKLSFALGFTEGQSEVISKIGPIQLELSKKGNALVDS
jgi:phage shock protein A